MMKNLPLLQFLPKNIFGLITKVGFHKLLLPATVPKIHRQIAQKSNIRMLYLHCDAWKPSYSQNLVLPSEKITIVRLL